MTTNLQEEIKRFWGFKHCLLLIYQWQPTQNLNTYNQI